MRHEERGPWYLLTALIIGISVGIFYSWIFSPVEYIDTPPSSLRDDYKDSYRAMVAAAFAANRDLPRARARLALLEEQDSQSALSLQAQHAQAAGQSSTEVHNLEVLAMALEGGPSNTPAILTIITLTSTTAPSPTPTEQFTDTPTTITETPTPSNSTGTQLPDSSPSLTPTIRPFAPTITPLPTRTLTPTPGAPFVLKQEVALVCSPARSAPLIIVEALDKAENPIAGVQVLVHWQGGEDRFYTGLKPELGLGYADFMMLPGVNYTVQLAEGGQPVTGLTANECESNTRERYWGAWRLVFVQP